MGVATDAPPDTAALRRAAGIVFLAALAVRLCYLAAVYDGPESLREPDSAIYESLAENLLKTGKFATRMDGVVMPETERMPGYVVYLAANRAVFGTHPISASIGQIFLDALSCLMIGWLALSFNRRLFLPAGMLAAANVNLIAHSALILTDSLFLFAFVLLLALAARYLAAADSHARTPLAAAGLGIVFGAALLVRTVVMFLPPLFVAAIVVAGRRDKKSWARALGDGALFSLCAALLAAPLLWRNYRDFGHPALTSQTGDHALYFVLPAVRDLGQGQGFAAARREADARFAALIGDTDAPVERPIEGQFRHCPKMSDPFACSALKARLARDLLQEAGIVAVAKAWVVGAAVNVFAPAAIAIPYLNRMDRPRFYAAAGATAFEKLHNFFADQRSRLFLLIILPAGALTALMRLLQAAGGAALVGSEGRLRWVAVFLLAAAGYFLAVTGPVTGVKYRLPLEPVFCVFLAYGLVRVGDILRAWRIEGQR